MVMSNAVHWVAEYSHCVGELYTVSDIMAAYRGRRECTDRLLTRQTSGAASLANGGVDIASVHDVIGRSAVWPASEPSFISRWSYHSAYASHTWSNESDKLKMLFSVVAGSKFFLRRPPCHISCDMADICPKLGDINADFRYAVWCCAVVRLRSCLGKCDGRCRTYHV